MRLLTKVVCCISVVYELHGVKGNRYLGTETIRTNPACHGGQWAHMDVKRLVLR